MSSRRFIDSFSSHQLDVRTQLALSGEPQVGWMLQKDAEPLNTYEYWQLAQSRALYVQDQHQAWEATAQITGTGRPIDAVLAPPSSCLPPAHGTPQYIYYTSFASLCDYTATVIPTGLFDAALDRPEPAHDFRCEADRFVYENCKPSHLALPVQLLMLIPLLRFSSSLRRCSHRRSAHWTKERGGGGSSASRVLAASLC